MKFLRFVSYLSSFVLVSVGVVGIIVSDYTPNPYELLSLGAVFYIGTELSGRVSK